MIDSLHIAWKYISFNKIKTATLVACITLISFLPIALQLLLAESERQLMSRAVTTPLVIGAKGSSLDLVMNTLYFGQEVPELITMVSAKRLETNVGFAEALLRAGVGNYIGTYWPVGDAPAKVFGETFYQQLVSGESLGAAMKKSRQKVWDLQSEDWADYILYGSPDFAVKRRQ